VPLRPLQGGGSALCVADATLVRGGALPVVLRRFNESPVVGLHYAHSTGGTLHLVGLLQSGGVLAWEWLSSQRGEWLPLAENATGSAAAARKGPPLLLPPATTSGEEVLDSTLCSVPSSGAVWLVWLAAAEGDTTVKLLAREVPLVRSGGGWSNAAEPLGEYEGAKRLRSAGGTRFWVETAAGCSYLWSLQEGRALVRINLVAAAAAADGVQAVEGEHAPPLLALHHPTNELVALSRGGHVLVVSPALDTARTPAQPGSAVTASVRCAGRLRGMTDGEPVESALEIVSQGPFLWVLHARPENSMVAAAARRGGSYGSLTDLSTMGGAAAEELPGPRSRASSTVAPSAVEHSNGNVANATTTISNGANSRIGGGELVQTTASLDASEARLSVGMSLHHIVTGEEVGNVAIPAPAVIGSTSGAVQHKLSQSPGLLDAGLAGVFAWDGVGGLWHVTADVAGATAAACAPIMRSDETAQQDPETIETLVRECACWGGSLERLEGSLALVQLEARVARGELVALEDMHPMLRSRVVVPPMLLQRLGPRVQLRANTPEATAASALRKYFSPDRFDDGLTSATSPPSALDRESEYTLAGRMAPLVRETFAEVEAVLEALREESPQAEFIDKLRASHVDFVAGGGPRPFDSAWTPVALAVLQLATRELQKAGLVEAAEAVERLEAQVSKPIPKQGGVLRQVVAVPEAGRVSAPFELATVAIACAAMQEVCNGAPCTTMESLSLPGFEATVLLVFHVAPELLYGLVAGAARLVSARAVPPELAATNFKAPAGVIQPFRRLCARFAARAFRILPSLHNRSQSLPYQRLGARGLRQAVFAQARLLCMLDQATAAMWLQLMNSPSSDDVVEGGGKDWILAAKLVELFVEEASEEPLSDHGEGSARAVARAAATMFEVLIEVFCTEVAMFHRGKGKLQDKHLLIGLQQLTLTAEVVGWP